MTGRDRRESDKGRDAERDDDERGSERKTRVDFESQDTRNPHNHDRKVAHTSSPLDVSKLTDIDAYMLDLP